MSMVCTMALYCSEAAQIAAMERLEDAVREDAQRRSECRDRSARAAVHVRPWPVI